MDGFDTEIIQLLNQIVLRPNPFCFYSEYYIYDTGFKEIGGALFDCGMYIPMYILSRFAYPPENIVDADVETGLIHDMHLIHDTKCNPENSYNIRGHHLIPEDTNSPLLNIHCSCQPCILDS